MEIKRSSQAPEDQKRADAVKRIVGVEQPPESAKIVVEYSRTLDRPSGEVLLRSAKMGRTRLGIIACGVIGRLGSGSDWRPDRSSIAQFSRTIAPDYGATWLRALPGVNR